MGLKARKLLMGAGVAMSTLGALGSMALRFVQKSFEAKAILTQRVQVDAADKLFNDGPTPIGSPHKMIIEDAKAVVGAKDGVRLVNDAYLQSHHIYPLQLKTVEFAIDKARTGFYGLFVLGWLLVLLIYRKQKREAVAAANLQTGSQPS